MKLKSESFIAGVAAVVFLVIGYQTALFIHSAAVTKIASDRDAPDTVFIYQETPSNTSSRTPGRNHSKEPAQTVVRKSSQHGKIAEAVRENIPPARIESFNFDPNTVSVEDLCRLGFSRKQAQSIENYRKSGGSFRRKSDFAKSYVVSDSIFRRLEPFIDIPLVDLNLADSATFDALPGIGGFYARLMVEFRDRLGGSYSNKEQLLDIYKFDKERFDKISDLISVDETCVTPYPLWRLPADSLRKHPYIASYNAAKAIVLFRTNTPKEEWTIKNLGKAGIISPELTEKLSLCSIEAP